MHPVGLSTEFHGALDVYRQEKTPLLALASECELKGNLIALVLVFL